MEQKLPEHKWDYFFYPTVSDGLKKQGTDKID